MVCGGGASHTLSPPGPPSLQRTFLISKRMSLVGRGTRIKSNNVWVLGSQWALHINSLTSYSLGPNRYVFLAPFCS